MVSIAALWLPILLSAVLVFTASSLLHMVLRYHSRDYTKLPNEDAVRAVIRSGNPEPAQYIIPHAFGPDDLQSPELRQKFAEGPIAILSIKSRGGTPSMAPSLVQWFIFLLLLSTGAGVVASLTLPAGTPYMHVFWVVGLAAWLGYAGGQIPNAIWWGKPWSVAAKDVIDGLIYALLTAGVFGWRWPR